MSRLPELPRHLQGIAEVYAEEGIEATPGGQTVLQRVAARLPDVPWRVIAPDAQPAVAPGKHEGQERHVLWLKHYRGRFLRFCPGTRHYRCCGYRIGHIGENCPVGCSYCILQAYFQDRVLKVWANWHGLLDELDAELHASPGRRIRMGTGEFTDSLVLEPLTGVSSELVAFLARRPRVCLELKSKVVELSWLERALRPDRVLPAWSMNAPRIVDEQEGLAASLEERLQAARRCADLGFRVCLHFDPVIRYPGWDSVEDGYPAAVAMIAEYLRPQEVAYISMGSFRFMPQLKAAIEAGHPGARYIYDEYFPGLDGKMRLLRPLRVEQYRVLAGALERAGFGQALYFCMESDEVWRAVLGRTPRELGGLGPFLQRRAFGED